MIEQKDQTPQTIKINKNLKQFSNAFLLCSRLNENNKALLTIIIRQLDVCVIKQLVEMTQLRVQSEQCMQNPGAIFIQLVKKYLKQREMQEIYRKIFKKKHRTFFPSKITILQQQQ